MGEQIKPMGSGFLVREVGSERIFAPEQFTEDQRMFAQTALRFMNDEVLPRTEAIEHPDAGHSTMVGLLKQAGELGLLMIDVPESYGGLGLDKTTSMLCSEMIGRQGSFAVSWGAHTGIGSMPITFFGTAAQKDKWLPLLASGEKLAAYALTEPGSGSDAMAARTTAVLEEGGGHYVLNGTKMWITNAGFADLFTVFCQVDGSKFTAFLVEADRPGLSTGAEERKMGLKGSSTRMLILDNVRVPVENLLGEVGRGHKIAFNILNIGRFKLGVGVLGGCKAAIEFSARYANERRQFGQAIASFGAIGEKFARMVELSWALESMCYRIAGTMDATIEELPQGAPDYSARVMDAIEDFAVEDSIMKVYGSEALDFVVDEAMQVFGGYGYSCEYPAELAYRDARINRIFEGTNEINRMLIPGMILKRTMKGQLPLFEAIQKAEAALAADKAPLPEPGEGLERERFLVEKAKQLAVYAANQAIQRHMADLKSQQELLLLMADMIMACYALDSTVGRALQLDTKASGASLKLDATRAVVASHYPKVLSNAEAILSHLAGGDAAKLALGHKTLDKLSYRTGLDGVTIRRRIAAATLERSRYPL